MNHFAPWSALFGGILIGISASLLLVLLGRIAGISGIAAGLLQPKARETSWRAFFVAGLLAGGGLLLAAHPSAFGPPSASLPLALVAGALVGVGTRLGSGCTSGHAVCGVSRWSRRSLAATATFMLTGVGTALILHRAGG